MNMSLNRENSPSVVAATFNAKNEVDEAIALLERGRNGSYDSVDVIPPFDKDFGAKVEPENRGIRRTLWMSHLVMAGLGALFGLLLSTLLVAFGPFFAIASPVMTFFSVTIISIFVGLILAGLFSLRPDHDHVINDVRKATNSGYWVLIVHTAGRRYSTHAAEKLKAISRKVKLSF